MSPVVPAMQKLRGHYYVMSVIIITDPVIVFAVMLCIKTTEHLPGMDNRPLLNIQCREKRIQIQIMPAFISIGPQNNGRMVYIMLQHFPYQFCTRGSIIMAVPAGQFVHYKKSEGITD